MYKNLNLEVFGTPSLTRRVDVVLPLTLKARKQDLDILILPSSIVLPVLTYPWVMIADGRCQVAISHTGGVVKTNWRTVWLSVGEIMAKCIRAGKEERR